MVHSIQNFEGLTHVDKISWIVEVQETATKLSGLKTKAVTRVDNLEGVEIHTLRRRRCQYGSHSWPAASMHSSTAFASSGLMLRILSSAFGDLSTKFCHASKRIAEGEVEPGLKTESADAMEKVMFKG